MTACAVVVDRDDGVFGRFGKSTNHIRNAFLHFRVGALHGIELYGIVVLAGVNRRYGTTTHTNAIVVATHKHHFFVRFGSALYGIALVGETYATGEHNHLVVSKLFFAFLVFESEKRATDKRLTKLITEVACTVRSFDKNFFGCLV